MRVQALNCHDGNGSLFFPRRFAPEPIVAVYCRRFLASHGVLGTTKRAQGERSQRDKPAIAPATTRKIGSLFGLTPRSGTTLTDHRSA